ncbi:MAG: winged helix-turn-helix transcriptional regulator [Anaerolineae bacterium]|nr:MAG: winged helix-turn-helix transcriptional regulator [Anaerolineae bacterium]
MKTSTRDQILQALLSHRRCSINDLAEAVGINPVSVRHHIGRLEASGLVDSENERHGVGRPRRVYFLTSSGIERFPSRYLDLSIRLVESMKETMPAEFVDQMFRAIASGVARKIIGLEDLASLTLAQRLELVRTALTQEGFTVEIEEKNGQYFIRETSCPYIHVGQEHPEVCLVDETLISTVLDRKVRKTHCVLDGDTHCVYVTPGVTSDAINRMETQA